MSNTTVIIGTGGFGREVLWACGAGSDNLFFVDDNKDIHGKRICHVEVIGSIEHIPDRFRDNLGDVYFVCGVGSPKLRQKFVARVNKLPLEFSKFTTVIDPLAAYSRFVDIGEGSVVCAGTILTTQVKVGQHVNINLDCTVGHDTIIEDYVNISPGVHISGYCTLKRGCDIGTGVNIIPHITIGENSIVGAGACVTKDVPPNTLVVGVPAVVKKQF